MSSGCAEPRVLDVGHIALKVNENGKLQARIDAAHASIATNKDTFSIGFGGDGPLDRHDWFLQKFSGNGWSDVAKSDRDTVYENREEAKRKKEEEERKKKEQEEEERRKKTKNGSSGKEQEADDKQSEQEGQGENG